LPNDVATVIAVPPVAGNVTPTIQAAINQAARVISHQLSRPWKRLPMWTIKKFFLQQIAALMRIEKEQRPIKCG
jgi:hypothetical protein